MDNFIKLIERDLKVQDKSKFGNNLTFIQKVIVLLLEQIKSTDNDGESILLFNVLGEMQFVLAKAVFKNGIMATPNLRQFISDFDRIDDEEYRNYLYKEIKSDNYKLTI